MRAALLVLTLAWLGCGHTHVAVDAPKPDPTKADPAKVDTAKTDADAAPKRAPKAPASVSSSSGLPLFTSPESTLAPGGLAKIQARLVATGDLDSDAQRPRLNEDTQRALRSFQESKNLPATGLPDDVTVHALGLDPKDIFRHKENH